MKPFIFIRPALVALLLGVCARSTAQAEVQLVEELSIGVKQPLKVRLAKPPVALLPMRNWVCCGIVC